MKRTTISLPEDLAEAVGREAERRRVSVSQFAREALETKLGWDEEGPREIPFAAIFDSGGKFGALSTYIDSDEFKKEYADWIYRDAFNRDP